jgi:hypothetical protein
MHWGEIPWDGLEGICRVFDVTVGSHEMIRDEMSHEAGDASRGWCFFERFCIACMDMRAFAVGD